MQLDAMHQRYSQKPYTGQDMQDIGKWNLKCSAQEQPREVRLDLFLQQLILVVEQKLASSYAEPINMFAKLDGSRR